MREIKFRAWSNEHNRYCDFVTLDENGRWIGWIKSSGVYLTTVDIVLEQDTGLKDENGTKIYEGGIVKYLSYGKIYIGQVVFDFVDDSEGFYIEKHYGWGICRDDYNTSLGDYADDNMKCEGVEVIGNIHQNPELMEGEE